MCGRSMPGIDQGIKGRNKGNYIYKHYLLTYIQLLV
jgi:hypothetical protein